MDFTDAYHLSIAGPSTSSSRHRPFAYSPGSKFFSTLHHLDDARQTIVQVRVSTTLQIVRTWTLEEQGVSITWSQNGLRLLVECKGGFVVLSLDAKAFSSIADGIVIKVKAGMEGLASVYWLDNNSVCSFSLDELYANIYNINEGSLLNVANPKKARFFASKNTDYIALLTRNNCKDNVIILSSPKARRSNTSSWSLEEQFQIHTNNASEIVWSPNDCHLAIKEDILEYKVLIYSTSGHLQGTICIDSDPLLSEEIFDNSLNSNTEGMRISGSGLGIRALQWSPDGLHLAMGGYDEKVRLVESSECTLTGCLDLSQKVISAGKGSTSMEAMIAWREPSDWKQETGGRGIISHERANPPFAIPSLRTDMCINISGLKSGISWLQYNHNGTLLAIRNENNPTAVYIYSVAIPETQPHLITVMMFSSSVAMAMWKPTKLCSSLAVLTSMGDSVHLWSYELDHSQYMEAIPIPLNDFHASDFLFAPDGTKMIISSQNGSYCCAIEAREERAMEMSASHL